MPLIAPVQINALALLSTPSKRNKDMAASTTAADFDLACATAIAATPQPSANTNGRYVSVVVDGTVRTVGDGVRTKDCYFSGDGGATARAFGAIVAGDLLYWVGTVAGFELVAATDRVSFFFDEAGS